MFLLTKIVYVVHTYQSLIHTQVRKSKNNLVKPNSWSACLLISRSFLDSPVVVGVVVASDQEPESSINQSGTQLDICFQLSIGSDRRAQQSVVVVVVEEEETTVSAGARVVGG